MNQTCKWTVVAVITAAMVGCEPKVVVKPQPPMAGFTVPESRAEDSAMLTQYNDAFVQTVTRMPGFDGAEHRQLLAASLADLSKVLRLLNGSEMSPEFMNRISVIDNAAKSAQTQSIPRPRMEGIENQALHSATLALVEIQMRYLFDDSRLPPLMDNLTAKTDAAFNVEGVYHDAVATDAFRAVEYVTREMTYAMHQRFGPPDSPDLQPNEQPMLPPLSQSPANGGETPMPATAPAAP